MRRSRLQAEAEATLDPLRLARFYDVDATSALDDPIIAPYRADIDLAGAVTDAELVEGAGQVGLDRRLADEQVMGL